MKRAPLLLLLLVAVGCGKTQADPAVTAPAETPQAARLEAGPTGEGSTTATGTRTFEGVVRMSKGSAFLEGHMLPHDFMKTRFGREWPKAVDGKRVRVVGATEVYRCGPHEQCLIEGNIPRFTTVTRFELLD